MKAMLSLQAAQEAVKHLEADLASALNSRDAAGSEARSAGVLRAEVAVLHARNARIIQEAAAFRSRGEEARKQVWQGPVRAAVCQHAAHMEHRVLTALWPAV